MEIKVDNIYWGIRNDTYVDNRPQKPQLCRCFVINNTAYGFSYEKPTAKILYYDFEELEKYIFTSEVTAKINYAKQLAMWLEEKSQEHETLFKETISEIDQLVQNLMEKMP